jgi:hypothetical protein
METIRAPLKFASTMTLLVLVYLSIINVSPDTLILSCLGGFTIFFTSAIFLK